MNTSDIEIMGFGFPGAWRNSGMRHVPSYMHTPYAPPMPYQSPMPMTATVSTQTPMPYPGQPHHGHHMHRRYGHRMHGFGNSDLVTFMGPDGQLVTFMGPMDSVKQHFVEHKMAWIIGGVVAVAGVGYLMLKKGH